MTYSRNGKYKYLSNIEGKAYLTVLDGERPEATLPVIANLIIDTEKESREIILAFRSIPAFNSSEKPCQSMR